METCITWKKDQHVNNVLAYSVQEQPSGKITATSHSNKSSPKPGYISLPPNELVKSSISQWHQLVRQIYISVKLE